MKRLTPELEAILQAKLDLIAKAIPLPPRRLYRPIWRNSGRYRAPTVTCPDCEGHGGEDLNPSRAKYDERHNEEFPGDWQDCETCGGTGEVERQEDE